MTSPDGREANLGRREMSDPDSGATQVVFTEPGVPAEHVDHPCAYRDALILAGRENRELVELLRTAENQLDAMIHGAEEPVAVLGLLARLRAKLEAVDAEEKAASLTEPPLALAAGAER